MKKTAVVTSLALGSLLAMGSAQAASPFDAKPMPKAHSSASTDAKTSEAKCGDAKCGATKKPKKDTKTAEGKCGEGKCGG